MVRRRWRCGTGAGTREQKGYEDENGGEARRSAKYSRYLRLSMFRASARVHVRLYRSLFFHPR